MRVAIDHGDPAAAGLLGQQFNHVRLAARVGVRKAAALLGVVFERAADGLDGGPLPGVSSVRIFSAASE